MKVGIVGMQNADKSSLFNALTRAGDHPREPAGAATGSRYPKAGVHGRDDMGRPPPVQFGPFALSVQGEGQRVVLAVPLAGHDARRVLEVVRAPGDDVLLGATAHARDRLVERGAL